MTACGCACALTAARLPSGVTLTRASGEALSVLPCLYSIFAAVMAVTFDRISTDESGGGGLHSHRYQGREDQGQAWRGAVVHAVRRRGWYCVVISTKSGKGDKSHRPSLCDLRSRRGGRNDGNHAHALPTRKTDVVKWEAADQMYKKVGSLVFLGGKIGIICDIIPEVKCRTSQI